MFTRHRLGTPGHTIAAAQNETRPAFGVDRHQATISLTLHKRYRTNQTRPTRTRTRNRSTHRLTSLRWLLDGWNSVASSLFDNKINMKRRFQRERGWDRNQEMTERETCHTQLQSASQAQSKNVALSEREREGRGERGKRNATHLMGYCGQQDRLRSGL